jgi:dipeptidyl aminopeptidase/acylaminoacyl peptidase
LGAADSGAAFASGHLLFVRGTSLMAQVFDPATRQTAGDAFPIVDVATATSYRNTFSVAATGVLGYSGRSVAQARPTWIDRNGKTQGFIADAGAYQGISLSPDEKRVAASLAAGSPMNRDIWVIDLARGDMPARLTIDRGQDTDPSWSHDGTRIAFVSQRAANQWDLFGRAADGSGGDEQLVRADGNIGAPQWTRDGRYLIYSQHVGSIGTSDLWVLPLFGDRKPFNLLRTPFNEGEPALSPDGRWLAYRSNSPGRDEVLVRPFPGPGAEYRISRNGGWSPRWRGDGKELYFLTLDGTLMGANIATNGRFQASVPKPFFETRLSRDASLRPYDVTADGERFLVPVPLTRQSPPITVVLNWPQLIKK